MAAGIKALRKIQLGKEASLGAGAAATARLIGTIKPELDPKWYRPDEEERGLMSSFIGGRSHLVGGMAKLPYEGEANYEQLCYLLGMALIGGVSGTGDPDYWLYPANVDALASVDSYEIEFGDDIQAYTSKGVFAKSLELSGVLDDVLKVKADLVGITLGKDTFTADISNPSSLHPIIMGNGKLYLDSAWATLGTTQLTATWVDFGLKLTEGIIPVKYADGTIYFSDQAEKKRHLELNLTLAHNPNVTALWTQYLADPQTPVFIRMEWTGPAVGGGNYGLRIDGSYFIDHIPTPFDDREGQDIVKAKLVSCYDITSSKEWEWTVTNNLATLP